MDEKTMNEENKENLPEDEEEIELELEEDASESDMDPHATTQTVHKRHSHKSIVVIFAILVFVCALGFLSIRHLFKRPKTATLSPVSTSFKTALNSITKPAVKKTASSLSEGDNSFNELERAFDASEEQGTTTTPSSHPASSTVQNANQLSISKLDKTLFEPAINPIIQSPASPNPELKQMAQNKGLDPESAQQLTHALKVLENLNLHMETNLNQIKVLEAYTREIGQTIATLNRAINAMDSRLLALTHTASSLSTDMGSVRSEVGYVKRALGEEGLDWQPPEPPARTTQSAKQKLGEEYTVHAIIPGRAWLKTSKGQILTVTEGETIGDYGKILVIDARNGVVLTSSGISFK